MHLVNNRKKTTNYKDVLNKVQAKLAGWKSNCLSLIGHIILAQSVLGPSVNYSMQHSRVPKGICNEVEKIQR